MNKLTVLLVAAASCGAGFLANAQENVREAPSVALVVQNHALHAPSLPMAAFADTLTARLSGSILNVINPQNVIGVNQNRTVDGEKMPEASAQEIGRLLNADGVVTASIQEFTSEEIGVPAVAYRLKVRLAINLADTATGRTVAGIDELSFSRNYTVEQVKADAASLYETQMHMAAAKGAENLLAKVGSANWVPGKVETVTVFFGCNVLGADVQIDGLSLGTCPGEFPIAPGIHKLVVSYPPYYYKFERQAKFFTNGQTFKVVLQITPEGEEYRSRALDYEKRLLDLNVARQEAEIALEKRRNEAGFDFEKAKRELDFEFKKKESDLKREMSERCDLFRKQLNFADAMLKRYELSGEADDYVRKTVADGTSLYWKNSFGRIIITDGAADTIEFATPSTDAGDLAVPPDPREISDGLQKLLMKRGGH